MTFLKKNLYCVPPAVRPARHSIARQSVSLVSVAPKSYSSGFCVLLYARKGDERTVTNPFPGTHPLPSSAALARLYDRLFDAFTIGRGFSCAPTASSWVRYNLLGHSVVVVVVSCALLRLVLLPACLPACAQGDRDMMMVSGGRRRARKHTCGYRLRDGQNATWVGSDRCSPACAD